MVCMYKNKIFIFYFIIVKNKYQVCKHSSVTSMINDIESIQDITRLVSECCIRMIESINRDSRSYYS